jgi:CheY-like chemotaxis protein
MLWIDTTKMEQVFINLISNAFKHSKKYGVITISVTEDENKAIVEVHDTGTGMDENTLQHIFDRFYSVGNTQNHGIGIGLHLSKEYAELHSGKLYAKSQLGSFSSFYVEIPKGKDYLPEDTLFVDASMVEDAMITNDEAVKEILARKYDDVVLIAEDDADIRTYLQEELSENFNTLVASNGYEATQLLLDNNVSVVLSDVLMPHINGYQLCREVKTNIATSHIPVILLTALTDESQMVHGVAEGADEYIRKPFNINYIKIKIINILEERRQLKEAFAREFNADKILDVEVKDIPCADDIFRDNLMDYMENNFENSEVGVDEMSSALGLSRVHLYRKTKSSFGLSPTDLLKKFRLRKAALLLKKDAGLSVSEVAYMTGFSSPAYFTRCFKEMFGVPPTAYDK